MITTMTIAGSGARARRAYILADPTARFRDERQAMRVEVASTGRQAAPITILRPRQRPRAS